jgi:N-acetylglutamate synthase-like GNAT family acetyltransferase
MIDVSAQLRTATPADFDAVSALLATSYSRLLRARYCRDTLKLALPLMIRANEELLACRTYYLLEDRADHLVGCGGWTIARPESQEIREGEAHIRHFATHPAWVRRGIGRSLIDLCLREARQIGIRKMYCYSTLNGECFYRSCGFDTVMPIDVPMGPNLTFPAVLMVRELA